MYNIFQGLVALVTGGASGLGLGTVQRFVKEGAKVVIADLPTSKGNEVAKSLGDSVVFSPMDVNIEKLVLSLPPIVVIVLIKNIVYTKFRRLKLLNLVIL